MKVLCLALACDAQHFVPGYPPKGAWIFMRPDPEASRLAGLVAEKDEFVYQDQRIETLHWTGKEDLCLVRADFGQENPAREVAEALRNSNVPFLLFGPLVTALDSSPAGQTAPRVVGDVLNAWPEIRQDASGRSLKPIYRASRKPRYFPAARDLVSSPEMNSRHQVMSFVRGCACPEPSRRFCPEYLYFGAERLVRSREEIVGEVLDMPHKHIQLLDDDVASDPEYYYDVFRLLWNYRRHWTVNAGNALFDHPKLIQLLAKAGTKTVFLNETFLAGRLEEATTDSRLVKQLYRRVKYLQARRMLVGAKVALALDPARQPDFNRIARVLKRIDLDFIETAFFTQDDDRCWRKAQITYHPSLQPQHPAWVRNSFYAMGPILNRLARRPRRVGFYTTGKYLFPHSFAYRQNFLEGIPGP